jgi:hypothetical protein
MYVQVISISCNSVDIQVTSISCNSVDVSIASFGCCNHEIVTYFFYTEMDLKVNFLDVAVMALDVSVIISCCSSFWC